MLNGDVITPPDVADALDDFNYYNGEPYKWASLEIQFEPFRKVQLKVGNKWFGNKEIPTITIHYHLQNSGGKVEVFKDYRPGL